MYVVGTHKNCQTEWLFMNIQIKFSWKKKKNIWAQLFKTNDVVS